MDKKITEDDITELTGQIIDIFQDFIDKKGIEDCILQYSDTIDVPIIEGNNYDELSSKIKETFKNWGISK